MSEIKIDHEKVLSVFLEADNKTRFYELQFHGFRPAEIAQYSAYMLGAKPERFSLELTKILSLRGMRVYFRPLERLQKPIIDNILNNMGIYADLVNLFGIVDKDKLSAYICKQFPFRFSVRAYTELKRYVAYPMYDFKLHAVTRAETQTIQAIALDCVPELDPSYVRLLEAGIYLDPMFHGVSEAVADCLINFRTCTPPVTYRLPKSTERFVQWVDDSHFISDAREGKYTSHSIESYQRLLYNLASNKFRDDLTDFDIIEIINFMLGSIYFDDMDSVDSILFLLRGYKLPPLAEYKETLRQAELERKSVHAIILIGLYGTVACSQILPITSEKWLTQCVKSFGVYETFKQLGGVLPDYMTESSKKRIVKSMLYGTLRCYLRSIRRHPSSQDHRDYTDRELMQIIGAKVVLFTPEVPLRHILLNPTNRPISFLPLIPRARNQTDFMNGNPIGTQPYIAWGSFSDYTAFTLGELEQITQLMETDDGKTKIMPFRPDDVKKEFTIHELSEMAVFIKLAMRNDDLAEKIIIAVEILEIQMHDLELDKLTLAERNTLIDILFFIIEMGFYMRRWKAPLAECKDPKAYLYRLADKTYPIPLSSDSTKDKTVDPTDVVSKMFKTLKKKSSGAADKVLSKLRIIGAHPGDPDTVKHLLEEVDAARYCIRVASRYLIVTCMNCLSQHLKISVPFKPEDVKPIS